MTWSKKIAIFLLLLASMHKGYGINFHISEDDNIENEIKRQAAFSRNLCLYIAGGSIIEQLLDHHKHKQPLSIGLSSLTRMFIYLVAYYGANRALTIIHELGHAVSGKIMGLTPTDLCISFMPGGGGHTLFKFTKEELEQSSTYAKYGLMALAGPIAGITGAIMLYKNCSWAPENVRHGIHLAALTTIAHTLKNSLWPKKDNDGFLAQESWRAWKKLRRHEQESRPISRNAQS